jgi:hypothetical protein
MVTISTVTISALGTQNIKRMLQVGRIVGVDRRPDMRARMSEFESHRMQPLAVQSQLAPEDRIGPVHRVPYQRMPD